MAIAPAVGLGFLVVFLVGAGTTYLVVNRINAGNTKDHMAHMGAMQRYEWESQVEKRTERLAIAGGIMAVILLILSFFILPREWFYGVWIVLTLVGVIFGILTFFIFKQNDSPESTHQPKPPPAPSTPPTSPPPPPAPPRAAPTSNNPYLDLLIKVKYDQALADRLIENERKRKPNATVDELCRDAIWHLGRDNH